jgi:hypothetical protein
MEDKFVASLHHDVTERTGGIVSFFSTLGARWTWVFGFTAQIISPGETSLVLIK